MTDLDELNPLDFASDTWRKLKLLLTKKLDEKRRKNDLKYDEVDTATLRGEIKQLKLILALEEGPIKRIATR